MTNTGAGGGKAVAIPSADLAAAAGAAQGGAQGGAGGVASATTAAGQLRPTHGQEAFSTSTRPAARRPAAYTGFGGAGASSTLTNAVTGHSNFGVLRLDQYAVGGAGGGSAVGVGGAAGGATSNLTFNDDTTNPSSQAYILHTTSSAYGGAGGSGITGAAGGAAASTLSVTGSDFMNAEFYGGAPAAGALDRATGGAGGAGYSSGAGGVGGSASGSATANDTSTGGTIIRVGEISKGRRRRLGRRRGLRRVRRVGDARQRHGQLAHREARRQLRLRRRLRLGAGGDGRGSGLTGGAGGSAGAPTASAFGFNAGVTVAATGGAGGSGFGGASGGAGGASSLTNAASGRTLGGALGLYQEAFGGAGGYSSGGATGAGGAATSSLTFDDVTANPIQASSFLGKVTAKGGAGGTGGQADATADLTAAHAITVKTLATGGAGGTGGGASATSTVRGTVVTDTAKAITGVSATGVTASRAAKTKTKTTGTSGKFKSTSDASLAAGQLITAAAVVAKGNVDGTQSSKTKVGIGEADPAFTAGSAIALEDAAPLAADTQAVLTANAKIASGFGASPSFFAIGELGGGYATSGGTAAQTTTESLSFTADLTKLASVQDLAVGFYGGTGAGAAGFSSLVFTLTADGTTIFTQTFTTLASAVAFFTDGEMTFGKLETGSLAGTTLTFEAKFALTTTAPGTSFFGNLIIGDPPAGATHFAHQMAGLGGASGASPTTLGAATAPQPLMLTAPRLVQIA